MKPRNLNTMSFASAIAVMLSGHSALAADVTWINTGATTAWLTDSNWDTAAYPATNDIAIFANSGTATSSGINMNTLVGALSLQAIDITSARSRALAVGNSSATTGVLTLTGATLNAVPNTILRNSSNSLLTIQNAETGTTNTMSVALGNVINNVIQINGSGGITVSTAMTGATSNLTLTGTGSGSLTLSGVNTYGGETTITSGRTLNLGGGTATGALASPTLNLAGGTLTYSRTGTGNTQSFTATNLTSGANTAGSTVATNTLNLGSITRTIGATLTIGNVGSVLTTNTNTNGILGGWATLNNENWAVGNGAAAVTGNPIYTATNATPATYTDKNMDVTSGTTTVTGGIITPHSLRFSGGNAKTLTMDTGNNVIQSGGILVRSDVANFASVITGGNLHAAPGVDLVVHQNNTTNVLTIGSTITDNSTTGLTKSGGGRLNLTATNNSYAGTTFINAGTLAISAAGSLPGFATDGRYSVARGATLAVVNSVAEADVTSIRNTNNFATGSFFGFDTTAANRTFSTDLTGPVNVQKIGTNTLTLSSTASTYTGATSVSSGTLSVSTLANAGANSSIGAFATAGAAGLLFNGGTLSYTGGSTTTDRGFTHNGVATSTINISGSNVALAMGATTFNSNDNFNVSGGSTNSFTIASVHSPSTAAAQANFVTSMPLTLNNFSHSSTGGQFTFGIRAAGTMSVGNFTGPGTSQILFLAGVPNTVTNYNGVISGHTGLFIVGGGTQHLNNTGNTFSGQFEIRQATTASFASIKNVGGGASSLGAPTTAANGTILFGQTTNAQTLRYTGTGDESNRVINLNGYAANLTLEQAGTGLLKFTSNLTATVTGNKTLILSGSTTGTGEVAGAIVNNSSVGSTRSSAASTASTALVLNSVTGLTVGNAITGTGIPANTTISAINTATRTVTLSAAATVAIDATITSAGLVNATSVTKAGTGTWTLSATNNTYTGATTVTAGTLRVGANNVLPNASAVSIGAATLDAATFTDTLGTLDATSTATINVGAGAALAFANSSAIDWTGGTLTLTGTFVSGVSLRFGTDATGLTPAQLASISATGFTSFALDSSGFLTASPLGTPFELWSGFLPFAADANADGISNGMAWLLGAASPTASATALLPVVTQTSGNLVLTFSTLNAASRGTATVTLQHSSDLGLADPWFSVSVPESTSTVSGVTFTVIPDGTMNDVIATIPASEAAAGKLFGRIIGQTAP